LDAALADGLAILERHARMIREQLAALPPDATAEDRIEVVRRVDAAAKRALIAAEAESLAALESASGALH
jgi:hypothetical protein